MPSNRPTLREVQDATYERLRSGGTLHVEDVAASIHVSKSTLQRALADVDTTFTQVRRRVQVEVAVERLTAGASCASTAAFIRLSGDHLCKLVTEYADLTPRQIVRACQLADRVRRWRRLTPPRADTRLYFKRLERWRAIDAELEQLTAGLTPGHPLAAWARKLRQSTCRPDYRRRRYRAKVRAERRREDKMFMTRLRQAVVWQRRQHEQYHAGATDAGQAGGAARRV